MENQWSLIELFNLGGVFMWPLLIFSIATIALILERAAYLLYHDVKVKKLTDSTREFILNKNSKGAGDYLESLPRRQTAASILLVLLRNSKYGESRMEKAAEGEAQERIRRMENGFNYLTALSSLAPLTGFLGTVSGMIGAFKSIAAATDVNAQLVANGIYEALITTVFGLIIAIIALIGYNLLVQRVDTFAAEITKSVNALVPVLLDLNSDNTSEQT